MENKTGSLNKVAIITLSFWVMKVLATTLGEIFYWIAILFSNSLGTAFGDFLNDNLGLSYLTGALITAAIIVIVVLLHYYTEINRIILFWIAFIFTRPFGATFGDLLTKPLVKGGLNFGRGIAAIITAALLLLIIFYSAKKDKELQTA